MLARRLSPVSRSPNKQLHWTVMDKVPRQIVQHAAAEPRCYAALAVVVVARRESRA